MAVGEDFLDHLRDLFRGLGPIRARKMFGGLGLYCDELFFAIAVDDVVYLKTDEQTRDRFEAAGARAFTYAVRDGEAHHSMAYWSLPETAHDDPDEAVEWGRLAIEAALRKVRGKR